MMKRTNHSTSSPYLIKKKVVIGTTTRLIDPAGKSGHLPLMTKNRMSPSMDKCRMRRMTS